MEWDNQLKSDRLSNLRRLRKRLRKTSGILVKTWCRVCGQPAVMDIPQNFMAALSYLYVMDDTPMVHREGAHCEPTNWGLHWRFDDVLIAVFGDMYHRETDMPYWRTPPWYHFNEAMARDAEVLSVDQAVGEDYQYEGRVIAR